MRCVSERAGFARVLVVILRAERAVVALGALDRRNDSCVVEQFVRVAVFSGRTDDAISLVLLVLVVTWQEGIAKLTIGHLFMYEC